MNRRLLPLVVQVLPQALAAVAVAAVFAGGWSVLGSRGFTSALSSILFIAAGLWLFGAGTFAPRMTKLGHMEWGVSVSSKDLTDDIKGEAASPVDLTPLGSAMLVSALLLVFALLLS